MRAHWGDGHRFAEDFEGTTKSDEKEDIQSFWNDAKDAYLPSL